MFDWEWFVEKMLEEEVRHLAVGRTIQKRLEESLFVNQRDDEYDTQYEKAFLYQMKFQLEIQMPPTLSMFSMNPLRTKGHGEINKLKRKRTMAPPDETLEIRNSIPSNECESGHHPA